MATHSSVLAWRIPGMESLVGCRLWGRTESDMTDATQQQLLNILIITLPASIMIKYKQTKNIFSLPYFLTQKYCYEYTVLNFALFIEKIS